MEDCELVVGVDVEKTLDAAAFGCSETSIFGPLQNDLETKGIESPPNITSPIIEDDTFFEAQTVVPKPNAVPTNSCSTFQPATMASSFVKKAIQGLGTDLLKLLK